MEQFTVDNFIVVGKVTLYLLTILLACFGASALVVHIIFKKQGLSCKQKKNF